MTNLKLSSLIPDVRMMLRDTNEGNYHFSDTAILNASLDAVVHLRSVRPESRYDVNCRLSPMELPSPEDIAEFEVSVDERWRLGLVYFTAGRCFECDVVDAVNQQLAATMFQKAEAEFSR